jgi:hypothetical protein
MGFKQRIQVLEGCDENVFSLGLPKGDDHEEPRVSCVRGLRPDGLILLQV